MKVALCMLLVAALLQSVHVGGQLLSNGASDWYMRFHKRRADAPTITSFQVQSVIKHRWVELKLPTENPTPLRKNLIKIFGTQKKCLLGE